MSKPPPESDEFSNILVKTFPTPNHIPQDCVFFFLLLYSTDLHITFQTASISNEWKEFMQPAQVD